jgi:hypothetical protein
MNSGCTNCFIYTTKRVKNNNFCVSTHFNLQNLVRKTYIKENKLIQGLKMKKETVFHLNITWERIICWIFIIGVFAWFAFNIKTLLSQSFFVAYSIMMIFIYMTKFMGSPHIQNKSHEETLLNFKFLLKNGLRAFMMRLNLVYILWILLNNLIVIIYPHLLEIARPSLSIDTTIISIYNTLGYFTWEYFNTCIEAEIAKKPYLRERSVFHYKPLFT